MSNSLTARELELPAGIEAKLQAFRQRVWLVKLAEGFLGAVFGLLLSYLLVFLSDRIFDTPALVRGIILLVGAAGLGVWFPWKCHRWIWRTRGLDQVARMLRYKFPRLGDQLLGIVELAHSETEQRRSSVLVRAAMAQVDEASRDHDFRSGVPHPRHRQWAWAVSVPLVLAAAALLLVPGAGWNAMVRWLLPWSDTERYTFAKLESLPDTMVVPYGEAFPLEVTLLPDTEWSPREGRLRYGDQQPIRVAQQRGKFAFQVPPQTTDDALAVSVGDARQKIAVSPTPRPELTGLLARVTLPSYLQRTKPVEYDVRGGTVSLVEGSETVFAATASRPLAAATVNGQPQVIRNDTVITAPILVSTSTTQELQWHDVLGLSAKTPFVLRIQRRDDDAPTLTCSKLKSGQVVLEQEVLTFNIGVSDDFGIQEVGLEWLGVEDPLRNPHPATGEKIVAAGDPEKTGIDAVSTFCAQREGVPPQTLMLRAYAKDYLPDRQRVYSPVFTLHVLSAEDHAIWLTEQFRKWFRHAQEVYETEQQLFATNQKLRQLPNDEIDLPENRRKIESQALAEIANGRRLGALTEAGTELVEQATKNDQFNVATLETWAEMLQALEDIANDRMPSVADLLQQSADAPGAKRAKPDSSAMTAPQIGENRQSPVQPENNKPSDPNSALPSITDIESGFNPPEEGETSADPAAGGGSKFGLPGTTLQGGPRQEGGDSGPPAQQKLDDALVAQEDLLAEFQKVADELQKILENLEGSTFVKRLKAASRGQLQIARELNRHMLVHFGLDVNQVAESAREHASEFAAREGAQSENVYTIQEDLEAYFNRVQVGKFRGVLNEMKVSRVVTQLKDIGGSVERNLNGQSIAEAEFWADTLDRWAEQLVGPGCPGDTCPGSPSADSLPPSIVLEVMKILEEEMALREETRALEQAQAALADDRYEVRSLSLARTQDELAARTLDVTDKIIALPDSQQHFSKEIQLLTRVEEVMNEARILLAEPNTGPPAIAAETEVIELLLQARRNSGGGGGGGGASPGGGGSGTTKDSALAQIGPGADPDAHIENRGVRQATGKSGQTFPEEFRDGLDRYFGELEGR